MRQLKNALKSLVLALFLVPLAISIPNTHAEEIHSGPMSGFMISPVNQSLKLSPGQVYNGSYYLMNPEQNTIDVKYTLAIQNFYRNNDGTAVFEDVEGRSQIASWITLNSPASGTLAPGASHEIKYTITVPRDVPGGGQYAAITASTANDDSATPNSTSLRESVAMAYTIFAEIAGNTRHSGLVSNIELPSFLTSGNISASAMVTNTGNVHETASFTLKVYPLFSSEPAYSNESSPEKKLALPDRSVVQSVSWEDTPSIGIFNVSFTASLGDHTTETVNRLVIKCPVWLIILILIIIIALVTFITIWLRRRHFAARNRVKDVLNP